MKNKGICFFVILILSFESYAWTISIGFPAHYPSDNVTINVRSGVACTNAGVTHTQLLDDVFEAADKYWNKVPTSRLRFIKGSVVSGNPYNGATAPDMGPNEVVVGCEVAGTINALGAIAVGGFSGNAGGMLIAKSYLSIDASANTSYDTTSKIEKLSILAHELGHAFTLGHSEEDSLMYYQVQSAREKLGEDDVAAVTFLYPRREEALGFGGSCASIALIGGDGGGDGPFGSSMMVSLFLGLLLSFLSIRPLKGLISPLKSH